MMSDNRPKKDYKIFADQITYFRNEEKLLQKENKCNYKIKV